MALFSLRQWRPRQLLLAWGGYWAGLAAVTLGPGVRAAWRATRLPDGHGTISASVNEAVVQLSVIEDGVTTWASATPFGTVALWLAGPPLVLWLLWLLMRPRREAMPRAFAGVDSRDALPPGEAPLERVTVRPRDAVGVTSAVRPPTDPRP